MKRVVGRGKSAGGFIYRVRIRRIIDGKRYSGQKQNVSRDGF